MHFLPRFLAALFASILLLAGATAFAAPTTPTTDFTDNGDGTVTHKITGLTWKRCAEGQTWTGSDCAGTASTHTWAQAPTLTSSFAGKSDWRLPTIAELVTIAERENVSPAVNTTIFPSLPSYNWYFFWSTSAYAGGSYGAWGIYFSNGSAWPNDKSYPGHVRLVRGGQPLDSSGSYTPASDFTDNGNGTATHKKTGLTWKRCAEGQTWGAGGCGGLGQPYKWADASALKSTYAGFNDWRLPTVNELLSIVEWSKYGPPISSSIFPSSPSDFFWSGSLTASDQGFALSVDFRPGYDYPKELSNAYYVRLVRGGQSVGTSSTTAGLTGLSLSCPSSVAAGASASCSASAAYSDGSSKTISPISWSSSNSGALAVSGGALSAGRPGYDVPVTITASYAEGGVTKSATATVTVKDTPITLAKLEIACTTQLAAGGSGACTASAGYSDNSSKAVTPTWSSSDSVTLSVAADGKLSAKQPASDTSVTISASYVENGVTKTATATVAVKAATTTTTSACSGSAKNLSAITIPGDATKHFGDAMQVDYCLKNFNSATNFDIYVAVQLPDRSMMFMQTSGFFQTPAFTTKVAPYLSNTLIPDKSGTVLSIPVLPLTLPTGTYTFYAIPVLAGGNVYDGFQWIGNLAKQDVTIAK